MKLFFRKFGEGKPLVVLHGVFGSSDNLHTVCKKISENGFAVYVLDARNHGQSQHCEVFNYDAMAEDLNDFLIDSQIVNPIILGHSMGGKTVMHYAQTFTNYEKIIVVDIAARFYPTHHNHILNGLAAIKLSEITSRKEAEDIFSNFVSDFGERQFILKNLYRDDTGNFKWRLNVPVISKEIYQIGSEIEMPNIITKPALMMRGEDSSYVSDEDFAIFKSKFVNAQLVTIKHANHWVHATNPTDFVNTIVEFAKD